MLGFNWDVENRDEEKIADKENEKQNEIPNIEPETELDWFDNTCD